MQPQQPNPQDPGQIPPLGPQLPPVNPLPQPQFPPAQNQPQAPHSNYDFIMNANHSKKSSVLSSGSMTGRIITLLVGLIILVVLFGFVKGLLSGGQPIDAPAMTIVTEDQQEIIHLLYTASTPSPQKALLSTTTQNFIVTGQLTIKSQQSALLAYLKTNGHKISSKQLVLKASPRVDKELTSSVAADTYSPTFITVMQNELATYKRDLSTAYSGTKAIKGRSILKADYSSAQLLLDQLNSTPANS